MLIFFYIYYINEHSLGGVSDRGLVMIDSKVVDIVEVVNKDFELNLTNQHFSDSVNEHNLDILVENMGRTNFGLEMQIIAKKGLNGDVLIDGKVHNN